jgi:hypothetical protein
MALYEYIRKGKPKTFERVSAFFNQIFLTMERSKINLEALLNKISEERINLAGEQVETATSQKSWEWSVTEAKSWNSQSWSK